ncbi:PSPA7_2676 family Cys-rich small protein [Pseudomonas sp. RIT-PI-AD]|uniref:PSPA7_2676 family Cys-rich small protein n=1 Tax=Pseudomonas sp. RIT-PI-AD TaxID=3035294 RepID=UPI0021DA7D5F|nr:PSPA7_2676 family Cys-rich small protein [Pseudomonas sp. RIT-PI-AD]
MEFRCVFSNCQWSAGKLCNLGGEVMLHQCCRRCGAYRYRPPMAKAANDATNDAHAS